MKYVGLHIAINHPLVPVNQSLEGSFRSTVRSILGTRGINLQYEKVNDTGEGSVNIENRM